MKDSNVATDAPVAADETRKAVEHEDIKARVENRVNAEIAHKAAMAPSEPAVGDAATQLRRTAIDDSAKNERVLGQARSAARISQFIDYAFGVIYSLLLIRLALGMMAANSTSGFVQFIRAITNPFYAPFRGIVASPTADGGYTLAVPIMIAIVVYAVLHVAINGMLRMVGHRKTQI